VERPPLGAKTPAPGAPGALPLLHVTATAGTADEAIKLSNAFGTELVKFINEREAAEAQKAQTEAATTAARIEGEIRALNDRIAANPPDKAQLEAQVDAKTREL